MPEIRLHKLIRALAACTNQHCVSIFMPVLQGEQVGLQNSVRLKNLVKSVEDSLIDRGLRPVNARNLSSSLLERTNDPAFWEDGSRGLAMFASPEQLEVVHLPLEVAETWMVGRHFHVTPLLGFETDREFAVLALSQNYCQLLLGDRWTLSPVAIPGLPSNKADALPPADHQRTQEAHGGIKLGPVRQMVITGQGGAPDHAQPELLAYFREVDRAICGFLEPSGMPLVLAAVRHLVPLYRVANKYSHLALKSVDGNPELVSVQELHRQAWKIVMPRFATAHPEQLARCAESSSRNHSAPSLHEIVLAAHEGRIQTLWIAPGGIRWGIHDAITGHCNHTQEHTPGAEDLLNLAAVETFRHQGQVFLADLTQFGIHEAALAGFKYVDSEGRAQQAKAREANAF